MNYSSCMVYFEIGSSDHLALVYTNNASDSRSSSQNEVRKYVSDAFKHCQVSVASNGSIVVILEYFQNNKI